MFLLHFFTVLGALLLNLITQSMGEKKKGLSQDRLTGLLRIDRAAVSDRALAASDKYDTTKAVAAKQSVRL
jgi:hypothetical protein